MRGKKEKKHFSKVLKNVFFICCFFLISILIFFEFIGSNDSLVYGSDLIAAFYPLKAYSVDMIRQFKLPLWNPYILGGHPLHSSMQIGIFYPLNVISYLLPLVVSINWGYILHTFLAGLFTYFYIRRINSSYFAAAIGGFFFMLSAFNFTHTYAGHISVIYSYIWLPALFLGAHLVITKLNLKYVGLLSIFVSCLLLAGHPQITFYIFIAVSFYTIYLLFFIKEKKDLLKASVLIILAFTLGIGGGAIQYLPSLELLKESTRAQGMSYEFITMTSFPPENIITFLIPTLFGDEVITPYWGRWYMSDTCCWVGTIAFLLATFTLIYRINRYTIFFWLLFCLGIFLGLGKYNPSFYLLYKYFPFFSLLRSPGKLLLLSSFSLVVLASLGWSNIYEAIKNKIKKREIDGKRIKNLAIAWITIGSFLFFLFFLITRINGSEWKNFLANFYFYTQESGEYHPVRPNLQDPKFIEKSLSEVKSSIKKAGIIILLIGLLIHFTPKFIPLSLFSLLFSVLILFDGLSYGKRYIFPISPTYMDWDEEVVKFLKKDKKIYRVLPLVEFSKGLLPLNSSALYEIESICGYDPTVLRSYNEYINVSEGKEPSFLRVVLFPQRYTPLINLLNVKYFILPKGEPIFIPYLRLIYSTGNFDIYLNTKALKRAFVVHKFRTFQKKRGLLAFLGSPKFNPKEEVLLEEAPSQLKIGDNYRAEDTVEILEYTPWRVVISAELKSPGILVISDNWYPCWKAYVNNKKEKIYRANNTMRAVVLPYAGKYKVEFVYEDKALLKGSIISILILLLSLFLVLKFKGKNKLVR